MNYGLSQRAVEGHLPLAHGQGRHLTVLWRRYITSELGADAKSSAVADGTGHSSHTWSRTRLHRRAVEIGSGAS